MGSYYIGKLYRTFVTNFKASVHLERSALKQNIFSEIVISHQIMLILEEPLKGIICVYEF